MVFHIKKLQMYSHYSISGTLVRKDGLNKGVQPDGYTRMIRKNIAYYEKFRMLFSLL